MTTDCDESISISSSSRIQRLGDNSSSPPPPFSLSKNRLRLSKQWRSGEAQ